MSQNSITLPTTGTVSGLQMTQYVNQALDTLNTIASGASAPASPEAGQLWHDTTANMLKVRSLDNTSWIAILYLNESAYLAGSPALGQVSGTINRALNGAMVFDQQNEGSAYAIATGGATYTVDQWEVNLTNASVAGVTAGRVSDAPAGYGNSLKVTIGTAASSVAAGDILTVFQPIEALNVADFNYGTGNAAPCSLSFWVKSSLTGTFAATLQNAALSRSLVIPFSIATANAWQQVKLPNITGDVTGSWSSGTAAGILLGITLAAGSTTQTSTLSAWQNGNFAGSSTQTNSLLTTSAASFQVTGVMLSAGVFCGPDEKRLYASELSILQRYYEKSFSLGTMVATNAGLNGVSTGVISSAVTYARVGQRAFQVRKRVTPTITFYNPSAANNNGVDTIGVAITSMIAENIGDGVFSVNANASGSSPARVVNYHWTANARM